MVTDGDEATEASGVRLMTAILAGCSLFVLALLVAIAVGCFLARCEREAELPPTRRPQPAPRTLRDASSLHARLLRAAIEGPKDDQ
jgi:hypothetical protein